MTHFAYPNIKLSAFIGCGRFIAHESSPGKDYKLVEKLNTGNIGEIMDTATRLSPASTSSVLQIFLKKDRPIEVHAGDSQNLAYLLAIINCSKKLKILNKNIWCTGSIEKSMQLKQVEMTGFEIKLKAFLSPKNNDKLFIVPAANIQAYKHLCHEGDVKVILLRNIDSRQELFTKKTVIAVHASDLQLLVDWLFLENDTKKSQRINVKNLCVFALIIVTLLSAKYYFAQKKEFITESKIICFYDFPDTYSKSFYPVLKRISNIKKVNQGKSNNKQNCCYSLIGSVSLNEIEEALQTQLNINKPYSFYSKYQDKEHLNIYFDAGFEKGDD